MASAVSYEFLKDKATNPTPDWFATLDSTGVIPVTQMPSGMISPYKGELATTALPSTGVIADYAWNTDTQTFWYWQNFSTPPAWVDQEITEADYILLTPQEQAAVPYLVIPTS